MAALTEGAIAADERSVEPAVIEVDHLSVDVIHARPDGMPRGGIVLHPDIMGLRPLFEDLADRLASHGFAVVAVEPFAQLPADRRAALDVEERMAAIATLSDEVQVAALEAAADHLVVNDDVTSLAVIGFCMGGHYALKAAASGRFDRAVAFYGMIRVPDAWRGPGVGEPLDVVADACPTLAVFGGADPWTPAADIDALRAVWADRDGCEIALFDEADHGFIHDPDRPAHRADDAATAWAQALAFLSN